MASSAPQGDAAASAAPAAPSTLAAPVGPEAQPMSVDSAAPPTDVPTAPAKEPTSAAKAEEPVEAPKEERKEEEKKSSLDEQTLYKQVKAVLMNAELSKTTVRSIAEQLNILFGYDFTDTNNKAVLKTVVSRVLDEREPKRERDEPLKLPPKKAPRTEEKKTPAKEESDDEEGDEEEDEEGEEGEDDSESEEKPKSRRRTSAPAVSPAAAKKKRGAPEGHGGRHEELTMSPALEKVIHVKYATRLDATKILWDYINGLDLVDGGFVNCNAEIKELFGEDKIRPSQIDKRIAEHLSHKDGTPLIAKKANKKEKKEKDPNKPKRSSIFSAEKILAQPLAELLGKERMSRGDVVKALHEYFKAHNLQDPKNRTVINFDPALEAVFHRKKTTFFKLNKLLVGKLMDPSEVV